MKPVDYSRSQTIRNERFVQVWNVTYFSQNSLITPQYGSGTANHSQSPGPMLMFTAQKLLCSWCPRYEQRHVIWAERSCDMSGEIMWQSKSNDSGSHLEFCCPGPSWRAGPCSYPECCSPRDWAGSRRTRLEQTQAVYWVPAAAVSTCRGSHSWTRAFTTDSSHRAEEVMVLQSFRETETFVLSLKSLLAHTNTWPWAINETLSLTKYKKHNGEPHAPRTHFFSSETSMLVPNLTCLKGALRLLETLSRMNSAG